MRLDLSSFENALDTLLEALNAHEEEPENRFIRDACIQRFEYSYELAYKFLRRYLEEAEPIPADVSDLDFSGLIRLGFKRGILAAEWVEWKEFRNSRNITSHAYDEQKADAVLKEIPNFYVEARFLLRQIKKRQNKNK